RSPRGDGPFVKIAAGAAEACGFPQHLPSAARRRITPPSLRIRTTARKRRDAVLFPLYLEDLGDLRADALTALDQWLRPRRGRTPVRTETARPRLIVGAEQCIFDFPDRRARLRAVV